MQLMARLGYARLAEPSVPTRWEQTPACRNGMTGPMPACGECTTSTAESSGETRASRWYAESGRLVADRRTAPTPC